MCILVVQFAAFGTISSIGLAKTAACPVARIATLRMDVARRRMAGRRHHDDPLE